MINIDFTLEGYEQYLRLNPQDPNRESIEQKIAALKAVNHKKQEEIDELFGTAVFNDIAKGYFSMALKNCGISNAKREEIMSEIAWLLDTVDAARARSEC